jgi:hypothetical protein
MIDILSQILCWIKQIGALFLSAAVDGVNLFILGIATFVQAVLNLLPDMPDPLDISGLPAGVLEAIQSAGYYVPFSGIVTLIAAVVVIWFAWLVLSVALRWGKAIPGDE